MADVKKNVLTYEGLKRYEAELQDLKVVRRKEIADKNPFKNIDSLIRNLEKY